MTGTARTFLPAAGRDVFLPFYDLLTKLMGIDRVRRALLQQAELRPGHRVLDVGCGTGSMLALVGKTHPRVDVVGIDPDPRALARARKKLEGVGVSARLDQGFADALPYEDGSFDRVISSLVVHHLERGDKVQAFREIGRVLAPGGRFELVDFGGPHDAGSRLLPRILHSHARLSDNDSDRMLALMTEAGLGRPRVVGRNDTLFGTVVHYQATRPETSG